MKKIILALSLVVMSSSVFANCKTAVLFNGDIQGTTAEFEVIIVGEKIFRGCPMTIGVENEDESIDVVSLVKISNKSEISKECTYGNLVISATRRYSGLKTSVICQFDNK